MKDTDKLDIFKKQILAIHDSPYLLSIFIQNLPWGAPGYSLGYLVTKLSQALHFTPCFALSFFLKHWFVRLFWIKIVWSAWKWKVLKPSFIPICPNLWALEGYRQTDSRRWYSYIHKFRLENPKTVKSNT